MKGDSRVQVICVCADCPSCEIRERVWIKDFFCKKLQKPVDPCALDIFCPLLVYMGGE